MNCAICGIRKPRRFCPGVQGNICTICCGTEREQTVDCPITCEYLQEAHRREKIPPVDPKTIPNSEVRVSEEFLQENEMLVAFAGSALFEGALNENAADLDVREALESLVKTYRTLESGLIYETRSSNIYAAKMADHVQLRLTNVREKEAEARGVPTIRDATILGVLIFLQRLEYMENNGRGKSKAFLDFLGRFALAPMAQQAATSIEPGRIVQPDEPQIIL